jgi:hypothetical protein
MASFDQIELRTQAATAFNEREQRTDGAPIVDRLDDGLRILRDLLCLRLREDVERNFGLDSMLLPTSALETERRMEREIDVYQAAVAAVHATRHGYVGADAAWCAGWLLRMRRGDFSRSPECRERLSRYLALSRQEQRLLFSDVLVKLVPQAARAPLVLFRLFPSSIRVTTSTAFGDEAAATESRTHQRAILPSIEDCPQCRGAVLAGGEVCPQCNNPLWTYDYLTISY